MLWRSDRSNNPRTTACAPLLQWDRLIDVMLRRTVYGTLAGSALALVVFRGPATRAAALAFGAGWGAGSAWQACAKDVRASGAHHSSRPLLRLLQLLSQPPQHAVIF
jgi:hypothetical protein